MCGCDQVYALIEKDNKDKLVMTCQEECKSEDH